MDASTASQGRSRTTSMSLCCMYNRKTGGTIYTNLSAGRYPPAVRRVSTLVRFVAGHYLWKQIAVICTEYLTSMSDTAPKDRTGCYRVGKVQYLAWIILSFFLPLFRPHPIFFPIACPTAVRVAAGRPSSPTPLRKIIQELSLLIEPR